MNRKQRRLLYKRYPKIKEVIKSQLTSATQELQTTLQKKWQDFRKIQSKEKISMELLRGQLKHLRDQERD